MIPVIGFIDCSAEQIAARIEEMMEGDLIARKVVVKPLVGDAVIGTYERIAEGCVEVEVDPRSQRLQRIPCAEIAKFGEYVPPLNHRDELRARQ